MNKTSYEKEGLNSLNELFEKLIKCSEENDTKGTMRIVSSLTEEEKDYMYSWAKEQNNLAKVAGIVVEAEMAKKAFDIDCRFKKQVLEALPIQGYCLENDPSNPDCMGNDTIKFTDNKYINGKIDLRNRKVYLEARDAENRKYEKTIDYSEVEDLMESINHFRKDIEETFQEAPVVQEEVKEEPFDILNDKEFMKQIGADWAVNLAKRAAEGKKEYHVELYKALNPDYADGFDAERHDHDYFDTLEEAKKWAEEKTRDGKYTYEISLGDEVVEKSDIEKKATLNVDDIKSALQNEVGTDEDSAIFIDVKETKDEYGEGIIAEVRAELDYNGMESLANKLNKVVQKFDPNSYFEQVDGGIMQAYLKIKEASQEKNLVKKSEDVENNVWVVEKTSAPTIDDQLTLDIFYVVNKNTHVVAHDAGFEPFFFPTQEDAQKHADKLNSQKEASAKPEVTKTAEDEETSLPKKYKLMASFSFDTNGASTEGWDFEETFNSKMEAESTFKRAIDHGDIANVYAVVHSRKEGEDIIRELPKEDIYEDSARPKYKFDVLGYSLYEVVDGNSNPIPSDIVDNYFFVVRDDI